MCTHSHTVIVFFFFFTPVSLKTNPRLLQYNLYHLTYMGRDIFLSFPLPLVPRLSQSYKSSFSLPLPLPLFSFTPSNPLCSSTVWWQSASLLGRWDSNQSGLSRGASDCRTDSLIAPRQPGRQAQPLQHMFTEGPRPLYELASSACESLSWTDGGLDRPHYTSHMWRLLAVEQRKVFFFFLYVPKCLDAALH